MIVMVWQRLQWQLQYSRGDKDDDSSSYGSDYDNCISDGGDSGTSGDGGCSNNDNNGGNNNDGSEDNANRDDDDSNIGVVNDNDKKISFSFLKIVKIIFFTFIVLKIIETTFKN